MATKSMVSIIMLASVLSIIVVNAAPIANVITVGDEKGWALGFDYQAWVQNKQFHVGDTLVFNYPKGAHNVIMVNGPEFQNCVKNPNLGILESGQDKIVLEAAGNMWFLCGVGEHCENGQKLKITVTENALPFPIPFPPAPSPAPQAAPAA
ncbi:hypothetical protein SUGI_0872840 [Cryptomeria japonica]|uniref:blue copper protein 1a-like n=1 Tax=Cryptomeria japonica TaxID=3369 RepID=UPI002414C239|nr:blue copper protein 1a-like [Cryptomeria japonica]GLJ42148.1 hypothetical protein SUGI_0872840 [Cryptomeria japonica]